MKKFLKYIFVLQEVSNKNRIPKLGRGLSKAYRFRVFNPLSYLVILITLIIAILCFGFIGAWKELDRKNPFKWF